MDEAAALAERQKQRVDPMYHEKIDGLLDAFARKLADNINRRNEIAARVPSILVAGGSNFPVRKKEKQNQADATAMEEYRQIRGLLDKIRGTDRGGISADDPAAVDKLKAKLAGLEALQDKMKAVNAYYRKHGTLDGCPRLSAEEVEKLKAGMARSWRADPKPYESYLLTNNNASIRQVKARIEALTRQEETVYEGWRFDGGEVKMDREINRLSKTVAPGPDALPPARLTLGLESADGMSAADILHVRQGKNYLVADFTRSERLREDPAVMDILARASREIGFDLVRVHEQTDEKTWTSTVVSFAEWDNPYFPATAPGSIAARYHDFLRQCYPFSGDDTLRKAQVEEVASYILKEGGASAIQLSLVIDGVAASCPNNADVQKLATELVRDLVQYSASKREPAQKQKTQHKKSPER